MKSGWLDKSSCVNILFFFFFGYLGIVELVLDSLTSADRIRNPLAKQLEASHHQFSTATINHMLFLILKAVFYLRNDVWTAPWTRRIHVHPGTFR